MKIKNVTADQLTVCLESVNRRFGYKLEYNRYPERVGNYIHFTIRSEKSGIPGSRFSWSGRKLTAASWHAHGHLFDTILSAYPSAEIVSAVGKIYKDGDTVIGNWQDQQIGSRNNPVMFSETSIL